MKSLRILRLLALAFVLTLALSTTAFAYPSFNLVNNSGRTITGIYCALSDTYRNWQNNVIGASGFRDGETATITLGTTARYWDLKAILTGGEVWIWENIDVERYGTVIINSDGSITKQ